MGRFQSGRCLSLRACLGDLLRNALKSERLVPRAGYCPAWRESDTPPTRPATWDTWSPGYELHPWVGLAMTRAPESAPRCRYPEPAPVTIPSAVTCCPCRASV